LGDETTELSAKIAKLTMPVIMSNSAHDLVVCAKCGDEIVIEPIFGS